MFGTLKPGSHLYVLNKGENPSLSIGQVLTVSSPRPKMAQGQFINPVMPMEQVMDFTVKVDDDTKTFTGVSPSATTLDTGTGGYFVSEDRASVSAEVDAFAAISQSILNSTPYHRKVVERCKQMAVELNPSLQKEAERDQEIVSMKKEIEEMRSSIGEVVNLLRSAVNGGGSNNVKKTKE
ncbi:MAG: hypothetical protein IJ764_00500 [Bacteroidales bacterium]|nr:hypothetical protein [Bacteroidales bacterium]